MTWSNLLSGLIGAAVGGIMVIVASIITMRQQRTLTMTMAAEDRRQTQLRTSYSAGAEILTNMLLIKKGLNDCQTALDAGKNPQVNSTFEAGDRIYVVYNALIADKALRSRINDLIEVIQKWYFNTDNTTDKSLNEERIRLIIPYMAYVSESIQSHLDDQPLPPYLPPPDLLAVKKPDRTNTQNKDQD